MSALDEYLWQCRQSAYLDFGVNYAKTDHWKAESFEKDFLAGVDPKDAIQARIEEGGQVLNGQLVFAGVVESLCAADWVVE
jgi:hypothetical protein